MQTVQPIDFRRARKENFSTCWDFTFEVMNKPLYFSVSSESVSNPNCRTCLSCACVGNFPTSLVFLAMLSEVYHGLGQVSVNNRLNFATLFIITILLRPAQNTVTLPCWKKVSPARGWRRVYTGLLAFGLALDARVPFDSDHSIWKWAIQFGEPSKSEPFNLVSHPIISHSIWYYYVWHNPPAILLDECSFLLLWNNLVPAFNQDV